VFTDEPANYRGLPWTRKGYDLREKIHELAFNMGDYVKTRCDYFEVASQLFSEAFYGQIGAWCRKNGLVFTGHLLLEEDLDTLPCYHGNVYTALREMDMPGIDWLGEKTGYEESALAETPDLAPKTASSIAHATGRRFVLCEYGGGSGWGTTLASLKNLVNYLQATGVNFMNHHAAHLSLKGLRKRDFPPSHFVQEPWWKFYRVFSDYIARLSYINSQGTHVADVLLLYPVRSIWAEYTLRGKSDVFERVMKLFGMISNALLRIQRDYDLLFEDEVLEGMVSVGDNCLEIADERFRVLILPPMTTIPVKVIELVRNFFEGGGVVVCLGFPPTNSDEREDDPVVEAHVRAIFSEAVFQRKRASNSNAKGGQAVFVPLPRDVDREELEKILRNTLNQLVESDIEVDSPKSRNLIYLHRRIEGDEFYFLANLSEEKVEGEITLNAWGRLEKWDPETGEITPVYVYRRKEGKTIIPYCFEPYEGVYFVVKRGKEQRHATQSNVTITGIYETAQKITGYSRVSDPKVMFEGARLTEKTQPILEPITVSKWSVEIPTNYMVLEPWTVRVLEESGKPENNEKKSEGKQLPVSRYTSIEELTLQINRFAELLIDILLEKAREMGIDTAAQPIPLGGSYEMTTEIEVKHVPDQILLVYEDLGEPFEVYINKSRVEETPQVFFLWDRSNRALDIKNYLKGIEPVVLVGKFAVRDRKIEEPKFKALEKAEKKNGFPHYIGDITLRQKVNLEEDYLERKLVLECTGFRDVVTVRLNGKEAGARLWPPYRLDITELVQKGENELEIVITNTAENLLGNPKPLEEVKVTITPYNKHLFNY